MAETKISLDFKWENNNSFELTSKEGAEEKVSIVKVEENSCIAKLWGNVQALAIVYVAHLLERIGTEMKEE